MRRLRLSRHDLKIFFPRVTSGRPCVRVEKVSSKNNKNWYLRLVDLYVPDKIQLVMIWRVVIRVVLGTRMRVASRRQRELEHRQWLERQCQRGYESESVECWQSRLLPKLLVFSPINFGEFLFVNPFSSPRVADLFLLVWK